MTFMTKTISLSIAALLASAPIALAQDNGTMKKSDGGAMMKKKSGSSGMMMKKSAPATGTGDSKGTATGGNAGGPAGRS